MGLCNSKSTYIAASSGGEREYQERFLESKTLGQGEFGIVKLVHDVKRKDMIDAKPLAVKVLRKGFTFRDNTLYTPLKKHVLQGEVEILRRLRGECYNLRLEAVFESPTLIYMVTEYCEGGEMMPWVSSAFRDASGMRTEDVSRISYQLWSAVDHCARHKVLHRDIKPENVMFCTTQSNSDLRLIDFGSGTLDDLNSGSEDDRHHTFAGTAFYISPEMFQKTYTAKTDVWSVGATLYVLVAGYPADRLQETFNILQSTKENRLRNLPNLPDNLPDSFYEMLEGALQYRHKARMDAGELMKCEFPQFHIHHEPEGDKPGGPISIHDIAAEAAGEHRDNVPDMLDHSASRRRTMSVVLEGSVRRHNAYLGYQKFERSVTALLATMLSKDTSKELVLLLREQHRAQEEARSVDSGTEKKEGEQEDRSDSSRRKANAEKLQVVTIKVLLSFMLELKAGGKDEEVKEVIKMITELKNFEQYENFAYHIAMLRQFVSIQSRNNRGGLDDSDHSKVTSVHGNNVWMSLRKKRGLDGSSTKADPDWSSRSGTSYKNKATVRRVNTATGNLSEMA